LQYFSEATLNTSTPVARAEMKQTSNVCWRSGARNSITQGGFQIFAAGSRQKGGHKVSGHSENASATAISHCRKAAAPLLGAPERPPRALTAASASFVQREITLLSALATSALMPTIDGLHRHRGRSFSLPRLAKPRS